MQISVRLGQTVSTIAQRYQTTVQAITDANHLPDANKIRVGQVLEIPSGKEDAMVRIAPAAQDTVDISGLQPPPSTTPGVVPAVPSPAPAAPTGGSKLGSPANRPAAGASAASGASRNLAGLKPADIDALVRAVAAEARGETPAVWAGIAQTIINYSRTSGMAIPHLTRTAYLSSNFDANRHFYTMPMSRIPHQAEIRQAVLKAADFKSPVGKREHFYDTSIRMPSWGKKNTRVQVGHVVFLNSK